MVARSLKQNCKLYLINQIIKSGESPVNLKGITMKTSTIIISSLISILTIAVISMGIKIFIDSGIKQETTTVAEQPKIMKVTPHYTTKEVPIKKCQMVNQTQMVKNDNKDGTTGGVIGGTTGAVAGGVIGKQIGGNTTGTIIGGVVGLVGGALAGNKIQKATQPDQVAQTNQVRQCNQAMKTVKKLSGYTVTYNYNGVIDTVVLKNKPVGQYLPLSAIGL